MAAGLDTAGRAALASELKRWLKGLRLGRCERLLAWVDDVAWPELVALATVAQHDPSELIAERAGVLLEEAARQMPQLVGGQPETNRPLHLAFERGYLAPRFPHPTQFVPAEGAPRFHFGGTAEGECGFCHQPLHHLLTHGQYAFATCLSCLGWEQPLGDYALSFRHDANGSAHPFDCLPLPLRPQSPQTPLRETLVALVDAGPRFCTQTWGSAHGANLNRLGGTLTWVQGEELRACRSCAQPMRFVLQLDSELPQVDGLRFAFGSGGVLFVQLCDACRVSTTLWQCT